MSQKGAGRAVSPETLAGMMLDLQQQGCHNINLVTPSHVVPQILAATLLAARQELAVTAGLQHRRLRQPGGAGAAGWRGGYLHAGHEMRRFRNRSPLFAYAGLLGGESGGSPGDAPASGRPDIG
ncbi:MAG: hypothetical protein V9G98_01950 [Candidatus Competibacter sp.]